MIGIAHATAIDDRTWSGIPAGLTRGLRGWGARVVHIAGGSDAEIRRAVERAGRLDGIVQMGSTFTLPPGVRYVTFEDATVPQVLPGLELTAGQAESWRRRQHDAYVRAAGCCVASEYAARSVREDYGIAASKVHVVGFGANLELEPGPSDRFQRPRFLFVGRDWERKNGPAVLRAFAEVRRESPSATLDVVGEHPELDGAPGVTGHGPLDHSSAAGRQAMARLFRRATCLVVPSRFEPFGIVYVEAGSAGVPSIGTSLGGAADAIGAGGVVVDPADDGALHDAMLGLCDPATAQRLGAAARQNAAGYSWSRVGERVLRALRIR